MLRDSLSSAGGSSVAFMAASICLSVSPSALSVSRTVTEGISFSTGGFKNSSYSSSVIVVAARRSTEGPQYIPAGSSFSATPALGLPLAGAVSPLRNRSN